MSQKKCFLAKWAYLEAFKAYLLHTLLLDVLTYDICLGTTRHVLVSQQCGLQPLQVLQYKLKVIVFVNQGLNALILAHIVGL